MLTVNSCCSFSLKTGTKIIAVLGLAVCVIQLAVYGTFGAKALYDISKALDQDVSGPSTVSTSTMPTTTTTTSPTTISTPTASTTTTPTSTSTSTTSTTTTSTTSATKPNKGKRSAVTPPSASQTSSTLTPEELDMKVVSLPIYMIAVVLSMVGLVSNSLLIHGVSKEREGLVVFWLVWMGLDLLLELVELVWNAYMSQGWFAMLNLLLLSGFGYSWLVVASYRQSLERSKGYQVQASGSYQELQDMELSRM
eukprot:GFUD01021351.1.p1 GENE.GFUD01021351.1~~GFUD01021351.1.p1  ORF type:complete len:252 (-),score=80.78 GFUD01021351.1:470-1225(-)